MAPAANDEATVLAAAAGDPEAMDAFCRRQHPLVYRLCLGFLACCAEAEDAAQDGMLRLLDQLGHWDRTRSFATWRNAVVLNLCRDRLRRARRRRAAETRRPETAPAVEAADAALQRAETRLVLERALRVLPPREREALVLRELEGSDTADVALVMGVSPGTVRSLVTLARRRLRQLLHRELDPGAGAAEVHRA